MGRFLRNAVVRSIAWQLARWLILLGTLVLAAVGTWTAMRYSIAGRGAATPDVALYTAAGSAVAAAVFMAVSERRVRADIRGGEREKKGGVAGSALTSGMRTGVVGSALMRGAVSSSLDIIDVTASLLSVVAAGTAVGWAVDAPAIPTWSIWTAAGLLGAAAGWTVARRAGAVAKVGLSLRDMARPVLLVPALLGGGAGAFGMHWLGATHGRVEWPTVMLAGVVGAVSLAGGIAARTAGQTARRARRIEAQTAVAVGVNPEALDESHWKVSPERIVIPGPLSAPMVAALPKLDGQVAEHLPEWEVESADAQRGIVLIPAGAEVIEARQAARDSAGLVVAMREIDPDRVGYPGEQVWTLAAGVSPAWAPRVQALARARGLRLIRWEPDERRAGVANLDGITVQVRDRIAQALRCEPWDVGLIVTAGDEIPVQEVVVGRAPVPTSAEQRDRLWREVVQVLPGGSPGWTIEDDAQAGRTVLTWGQKPELPALVPLADLLPEKHSPEDWALLPFGIGADGKPVGLSLTAGPHALLAGPTGSGKTVGLVSLIAGALTRGHQLVLIDPTKAGLDFAALRPWALAWADELPAARKAMEMVYEEVGRRKEVLKKTGEVKWDDVDATTRDAEGLKPMTVLIDEYGSLALEATINKNLDKDDPLAVMAMEENAHKAIIKELVGRIAREARFVGIHLQIALQRPDVGIMGSGELRSNLTSRVQLSPPGQGVSHDALRMLFDAEAIDSAADQIAILDDGKSRGLGVVAAEGGRSRGMRVAFAPMRDLPALLDERDVPRVNNEWDLGSSSGGGGGGRPSAPRHGEVLRAGSTTKTTSGTSPAVAELDLTDLDLGDATEVAPDADDDIAEFDFDAPEPSKPASVPVAVHTDDDWGF